MLTAVALRPGINSMITPALNEGGWSEGNLVRFRQGLPEKMRGWRRFLETPMRGVARAIEPLYSLAGDAMLGIGTHSHLYVVRGKIATDVTPVDRTLAVAAGGIVSASGSRVVTVTLAAPHNLAAGDWVTFDTISGTSRTLNTIAFNGLALANADFAVVTVISPTAFTFEAGQTASASGSWGSASTLTCFMAAGPIDATPGLGYGAGGYGVGPYGLAASQAANTLPARLWSLARWGQAMLGAPTMGRLLYWQPDSTGNINQRASYVTHGTPALGPPLRIGGMCVGMPERHVLAFGCSDLGSVNNYDPMLVRFSDVEDYTSWQASPTNSAGSFRLQGGSHIVGWLNSTLQTLIWTDQAMWVMRYVGAPFFYSFTQAEGNAGLIAQNARAEMGGVVYWMGPDGFWAFRGGAPEQLVCTMHDEVFDHLNRAQAERCFAATVTAHGEVFFFYPSNTIGTDGQPNRAIDRYVCLNTKENTWYGGHLARTAWTDRSPMGLPMATDAAGNLYTHEDGQSADGVPMGDFIQSGWFDVADGEAMMFCSGAVPDLQSFTGELRLLVDVQGDVNRPPFTMGPYTITPGTLRQPFRFRGRAARFRLESVGAEASWRLGKWRFDLNPDGTR